MIENFIKDDGSLNLSKLTKSAEGKKFLVQLAATYGEGRPAQLAYRAYGHIVPRSGIRF